MPPRIDEDARRTGLGEAAGALASSTSSSAELPEIRGYDLVRLLGAGGMGIVYQALDCKRRQQVALKTLRSVDPSALYFLKQEFRALTEVAHRNLVSYFELVAEPELCFLTMELIAGTDLLAHVRGGPAPPDSETLIQNPTAEISGGIDALPTVLQPAAGAPALDPALVARVRDVFGQLADGVDAIHRMGKLHRDLKPSNVMVDHDGRVVILDFGLAAELDAQRRHQPEQVVGTVAYMAPEQASVAGVSPASDWYSFGVMLYEALTGRLPYSGRGGQVLAAKQTTDAPPPSAWLTSVPDDLNRLCVDLLQRSPSDRPDGAAVLRRIRGTVAPATASPAPLPSACTLIGREDQLARLRDAYDATRSGTAIAALVHGRSGVGKSALVQRFLDDVARQQAVVLSGKCYERESVPYKALDSLVDALSRHLGTLAPAEIQAVLPREIHLLTRLFPVLNRVPAIAGAPGSRVTIVDPLQSRLRAFEALRELLARLGDRRPLVLFIDDLQWGDTESAAALAALVEPPHAPACLLVGSYRSEEFDSSACLQSLLQSWTEILPATALLSLPVEPLSDVEVEQLARMLLGNDPHATTRSAAIVREAQGNPFFVQVLAHGLESDGALAAARNADVQVNLDQVLWNRMQLLAPQTRQLLEVIAVSGQPLSASEACRAAGFPAEDPATLTELRYARLIRSSGPAGLSEVETFHDRVRESILDRLSETDRREHHFSLALALEHASLEQHEAAAASDGAALARSQERRLFSLAWHFDSAGDSKRALPYALAAATRARTMHALQIAEQQFLIAQRGAADADPLTRFQVAEGLGDVFRLRGNYDGADRCYDAAVELAPTTLAQAEIERKRGDVAFKRGDLPASAAYIERALRRLGKRIPRSNWMFYLVAGWEGLVQVLHTYLPSRFLARRPLEESERDRAAIRLYSRLDHAYWFSRGPIPCFWAHLRSMNLAERYPATPELAQAYSEHGPGMSMIGHYERGIRYAEQSLVIRRALGDVWGQGQSLHYYGVILYAASRFEECIEKGREGARLLEQTGDPWERNSARYQVALALYRLGALDQARDEAWRFHESAVELGDTQGAAMSLDAWSLACLGRVPAEVIHTELARPSDDVQRAAQVMLAEAVRLLAERQPADAVSILTSAIRQIRKAGLSSAFVSPVFAWLVTALRLQARAAGDHTPQSRAILRQAQAAARRARRVANTFQNDLPHVLRELALLAALAGSAPRARRCFAQSLELATRQHARYERAVTFSTRAALGTRLGWPEAESDRAAAAAAFAELHLPAMFAPDLDPRATV